MMDDDKDIVMDAADLTDQGVEGKPKQKKKMRKMWMFLDDQIIF